MAFKSACFISYPHNAGKSVDRFVTRLKDELQDRIAQFVTDPIVTDHDFPTGADFHAKIAKSICESACLIVVYMPVYQRKPFCVQEYIAMERLQANRYNKLQLGAADQIGMILPIVYAGGERKTPGWQSKIPAWVSDKINYKDITLFTISDPLAVFDQTDFQNWLGDIANLVDSIYNTFQKAGANPTQVCGGHTLPDPADPDVQARLNIPTRPPDPFR